MDQGRRADIVRLLQALGDAWLLEPTDGLLQRLSVLPPFAHVVDSTDATEMAIIYSEVMLHLAPPYASMFLSDTGMLNAEPAEDVLRLYVRSGFEVLPEWRAGAADHLGVELYYLAWLISAGSPVALDFLNRHLLTWAPVCCLAVERAQAHPFYSTLARTTLDVLLALGNDADLS